MGRLTESNAIHQALRYVAMLGMISARYVLNIHLLDAA